jgi:hypothetical protein
MAFCPNCGTPNTDQAEKCVSCSFDLAPKQKAKFKGTIMMQGVQLPGAAPKPAAPAPAPAPSAAAAPAPAPASLPAPAPATGKNVGFEKTILGAPGLGGLPAVKAPSTPAAALGDATTVDSPRPRPSPFSATEVGGAAPAADSPSFGAQGKAPPSTGFGAAASPSSGGFGTSPNSTGPSTGGFGKTGGFGNTGGFGGSGSYSTPPGLASSSKLVAIGGGAVAVLVLIIVVWLAKGSGSSENSAAANEWRGSLTQALTQVAALCSTDCQTAGVYFHPKVQAALLDQAKQLKPERAAKFADPEKSQAEMLDTTDDGEIATKLELDPTQCVRVVAGSAKVVGCSVPTPGGQPNLRIVHLEGVPSL